MHVLKTVLLMVGVWTALTVVVWYGLRRAKRVAAGHPDWVSPMAAEEPEEELYVDPEGPFGPGSGK